MRRIGALALVAAMLGGCSLLGLTPLPWSVEARTVSGRKIGAFAANISDLQPTLGDHGGVA